MSFDLEAGKVSLDLTILVTFSVVIADLVLFDDHMSVHFAFFFLITSDNVLLLLTATIIADVHVVVVLVVYLL